MIVSVLIAARNADATLARTLDSLLAQSHPSWQAIVVDDASSDMTGELANRYATRDPRISVLAGPGRGVAAARNLALAHAIGQWLMFLDADDWIAPEYMERMLAALADNPKATVCCCAYQRVTPSAELLPPKYAYDIASRPAQVFARSAGVAIHALLLDRALVQRLDGFDGNLRVCEDWELWQRVAATGAQFVVIDDVLAFYRMRPGSLTRDPVSMIEHARIVIERGFAKLVAISGAATGGADEALYYFALWAVAQSIPLGAPRIDLLDTVPAPQHLDDLVSACVETLLDGLSVGACCPPQRLADQWHNFAADLDRLIDVQTASANHPGFKRRVLAGLARRLLGDATYERSVVVGPVLALRSDILRPVEIVPPAGVDMLYLELCRGDSLLGRYELPIVGRVTASELQALAVELLGRRRYWRAVAAQGLRVLRVTIVRTASEDSNRVRQAKLRYQANARACVESSKQSNKRVASKASASGQPASSANWGEEVTRCSDLCVEESTSTLPVLMYHSVSDSGPDALARYRVTPAAFREQMGWLRRHGYYAVSPEQVAKHFRAGRPFSGRPVMITFDDGCADFAENAWPIVRDHGLSATNFIVTGHVGGHAEWDASYGAPAALMSWEQIESAGAEGAFFGSHMVSHTAVDGLSTEALVTELASSSATLAAHLNTKIKAFAAPYGITDGRLLRLLYPCGYRLGFTTEHRIAKLGDSPYALPRLEISGEVDLNEFARLLRGDAITELVSVIIPAYNAQATIDETLCSVRAQTHAQLEILVVDDGSSDETPAIVERHARIDSRVRLLRQNNAGVAAARNFGSEHATAELLAFVDADDLWATTKIEKQVRALRDAGPRAGLVYTWFAVIDEGSRILDTSFRPTDSGDVLERLCFGNLVGNGSSTLVTRRAFQVAGGFDPSLRARKAQGCEDLHFYFRVAEHHDFALVPEHLTGYRRMAGNMSSDLLRMLRSRLFVSAEMIARQPRFMGTVRRGDADFVVWLLSCAVSERRVSEAVQLGAQLAGLAPRDAARALKSNLKRFFAYRKRPPWRGAECTTFVIGKPRSVD